MKGSWAGAMGQTQFMPSSFREYAVDFEGDGRRDIWTSAPDAIGSTANYLAKHGWIAGQPWGFEVTLPEDFELDDADSAHLRAVQRLRRTRRQARRRRTPLPSTGEAELLIPAGLNGPIFLVTRQFQGRSRPIIIRPPMRSASRCSATRAGRRRRCTAPGRFATGRLTPTQMREMQTRVEETGL